MQVAAWALWFLSMASQAVKLCKRASMRSKPFGIGALLMRTVKLAMEQAFTCKFQSHSFIIKLNAPATPRVWKSLWLWGRYFYLGPILVRRKPVGRLLNLKFCAWGIISMAGATCL